MFLEEIVLEGFKSYATKTVISGFDPAFNAITGLNGSGKSNILDAICFVLGIRCAGCTRGARGARGAAGPCGRGVTSAGWRPLPPAAT